MGAKHEYAAALRDLLASALNKRVSLNSPLIVEFGFEPHQLEGVSTDGKVSYEELLVLQLVHKACAGSDKAATEVLDRLAGKPTQVTENLHGVMNYETYLENIANEVAPLTQIENPGELEDLLR